MTKLTSLAAIGILALALTGGATTAFAFKGQEYAKEAAITLVQARAIALKAVPGKITDEELEKEKGGSGLRYSFDIKTDGTTHEVGIDAKTGKVLENSIEGPHSD
jgi:uncharacterized membrane protein YkoI